MDLHDLLHSVPPLLTLLTECGCLAELQAVSRKCYLLTHSHVTRLHLAPQSCFPNTALLQDSLRSQTKQHLQTLVAGFWPNLQSLSLGVEELSAECAKLLEQAQWPKLEQLHISANSWEAGCMLHVSKAQTCLHSLSVTWPRTSHTETEIEQLTQAELPQLSRLHLSSYLRGLISPFGTWPVNQQLRELDLSFCHLDTTDLQSLALHKWLVLEKLNLSWNKFDGRFLHVLCEACPPILQELNVSSCATLDPFASKQAFMLPTSTWPVLTTLKMAGDGINHVVMSELKKIKCLALEVLDLTANHCTASMVQSLVNCSLPHLTELRLSWGCLNLAGVRQLIMGCWPNLSKLDVSGNDLCVAAVSRLMSCTSWPVLQCLDLCRNRLARGSYIVVDVRHDCHPLSLSCLVTENRTMPAWLLVHWPHLQWVGLSDCRIDSD